ncbi:MAG: hypothetical protein NZ914_09740 [Gemmatales bacterium]|nr:hypothetical protein [Gemmatales bacterium]
MAEAPFKLSKALLAGLGVYALWLAALAWLAWTSPGGVVVRAQLQAAPAVVIGRVVPDGAGGWQVRILERLKPVSQEDWLRLLHDSTRQQRESKKPPANGKSQDHDQIAAEGGETEVYLPIVGIERSPGWQGTGDYLLALVPPQGGKPWRIAPAVVYPGVFTQADDHRPVYPATPSIRRQAYSALSR